MYNTVMWQLLKVIGKVALSLGRVIVLGLPQRPAPLDSSTEARLSEVERKAEATRRKVYRDIADGKADYIPHNGGGGSSAEALPAGRPITGMPFSGGAA